MNQTVSSGKCDWTCMVLPGHFGASPGWLTSSLLVPYCFWQSNVSRTALLAFRTGAPMCAIGILCHCQTCRCTKDSMSVRWIRYDTMPCIGLKSAECLGHCNTIQYDIRKYNGNGMCIDYCIIINTNDANLQWYRKAWYDTGWCRWYHNLSSAIWN